MLNKSIDLNLRNNIFNQALLQYSSHTHGITEPSTSIRRNHISRATISNSCFLHQVSLPARLQWQELFDQHRWVRGPHLPERGGVQGRHQQLQVCVSLRLHGALLWDRTLRPAPLPPGQRVWAPRLPERCGLLPAQLNCRLRLQMSPWWVNVELDLTPSNHHNQTTPGNCSFF